MVIKPWLKQILLIDSALEEKTISHLKIVDQNSVLLANSLQAVAIERQSNRQSIPKSYHLTKHFSHGNSFQ